MRKSWIAVAIIALAAGLGALNRGTRREPPPPAFGPERPTAKVESRAPARRVPEFPGRADPGPFDPPKHDDASLPQISTLASPAGALPEAAASSPIADAPVALEPAPVVPVPGGSTPPPLAQPSPSANSSQIAIVTPREEPAEDERIDSSPDDPESDRKLPVLESLRFDPAEIKDGGLAVLTIGTSDDLSGVKLVTGTVRSPSGPAGVPFTAEDTAGSGAFTAAIAIPRKAETGDWFVGNLHLVDRADNVLSLNFEKATVPQGGLLRVVSAESDSTAPTVQAVSVEKGQVDPGEADRVVIEVEDDLSGVASVTGAFQNPSKSAFIAFTAHPTAGSSWSADVPVPSNADCGDWTLRHLRVADNANNATLLTADDPQLPHVSFFVTGGGACDSQPPVIEAVSFDPAVVSNAAAAEIVLTVLAHDEGSGVASLFGRIEGPASPGGQVPWILFDCAPVSKDPAAPMTAKISVPQFAAKGIWSVIWIQVTDKAHNTHPYYRNDAALAGGSFRVE